MKTRSEVYQSLKPELHVLEKDRLVMLFYMKIYRYLYIVSLIICFVIVLLFFTNYLYTPLLFLITLVIVLHFNIAYHNAKEYFHTRHKSNLMSAVIKSLNHSLEYNSSKYIELSEFLKGKFYDRKVSRYRGAHWLKGKLGNTNFEYSKIHAEYFNGKKKNGENIYGTLFKGIFIKADFHKHFSGETFVLTDKVERKLGTQISTALQNRSIKGSLVYMENISFEKEFMVYSSDEVEARYILSISMLERILALKRKFNRAIQFSFVDSSVYITIPANDVLDIDIEKSLLTPMVVYKIYRELKMCFDIIEDLNLNTRIWSKQAALNT